MVSQKINFLFVMVETARSTYSKAIISSAETKFPLRFKHSIWDSLKASASFSTSSMMIKLLDISKSLRQCWFLVLISYSSLMAVFPEHLVSERWATFKVLVAFSPLAINSPPASPIGLLLMRSSLRLLLTERSYPMASPASLPNWFWLRKSLYS